MKLSLPYGKGYKKLNIENACVKQILSAQMRVTPTMTEAAIVETALQNPIGSRDWINWRSIKKRL